jgi:hypothetical protein
MVYTIKVIKRAGEPAFFLFILKNPSDREFNSRAWTKTKIWNSSKKNANVQIAKPDWLSIRSRKR